MNRHGLVLWDFDGTLATRPGHWSGCLVEVLDEHLPGHGRSRDDFRPALSSGFPWHQPDRPHPGLSSPEAWWSATESLLAGAYESLGIVPPRSRELAHLARLRYVRPDRWRVFSDARPALERLAASGWEHAVLSNHVPELPEIVEALGLGDLMVHVFTSAATGFEKPHPDAFRTALDALGRPANVWMVGDNPDADVAGAEQLGIPAILVRSTSTSAWRSAHDLHAAADIIENELHP